MSMKKRGAILFKSLVFFFLLCVLFCCIQDLFIVKVRDNFQLLGGFFEEPKDSLDVVYIGASPTFTSWSTPIAYKKYGITSWTYANNCQPFAVIQKYLETAYREQPNAVFLICINGLYNADEVTVEDLHASVDHFRPSFEKLALIDQACHDFQSTPEEYLELLVPMVRYHSQWTALSANSFHRIFEEYKGAYHSSQFFTSTDVSWAHVITDQCAPLNDFTQKALNDLLLYCKRQNIKAVFVLSVQYWYEARTQCFNSVVKEIEAQGFPVVNVLANVDEIGIDDKVDFYNPGHTNIHGALKITDYLSQYLLDHYDFPEKSIGGGYESWDIAYDKYKKIITPYLSDEELNLLP